MKKSKGGININNKKIVAIGIGYVDILFHSLISFILTPLMISIWGDASYGVYKIVLSFMTYFLLIDSGIRNTVIRFVSEYRATNDRENERRYIATVTSYYFIAALILCGIVSVLYRFIPTIYSKSLTVEEINIVQKALPWLTLYTVATLFYNCFSALLRGHNKQITIQGVNILRTTVRFLFVYLALNSGVDVVYVIGLDAIIAVAFAMAVLTYVFLGMKLPPKFKGIDKSFIKKIVDFTTVMLLLTVADSLFWSTGTFLVGVMTSSVMVAIYTTAITLTNIFQSLIANVSHVLVPDIMVKSIKSDNMAEMNEMMIKIGNIKSYIMLPIIIGFLIFGNDFVRLWVGDGYTGTWVVAAIIMSVLYWGLVQDVPNNYVLAKNKHKKLALVTLICSLINIAGSVFLIKLYGIYGAAMGTAISYFVVNFVYKCQWFTKAFGFNMRRLYGELLLKKLGWLILLAVIGVFIQYVSLICNLTGWIFFITKIIVFCVFYVLVLIYCILGKEERAKLMKKLRR